MRSTNVTRPTSPARLITPVPEHPRSLERLETSADHLNDERRTCFMQCTTQPDAPAPPAALARPRGRRRSVSGAPHGKGLDGQPGHNRNRFRVNHPKYRWGR